MKKTALTLALATVLGAPLAAQADTILYGEARPSLTYTDVKNGPDAWDVTDDGSKLGIKGFEDLGGGLKAIYMWEFNVDMTDGGNFSGTAQKFAGLSGGFGTLTLGTQDTPYWKVLNVIDVWNSGKVLNGSAYLGGTITEETSPHGALSTVDNNLDYQTPVFGGFSAEAMVSASGGDMVTNDIDIWSVNLKYDQGPIFAGLTYIKLNGDNNASLGSGRTIDLDLDNWGLGLGYKTNQFLVGFIYEQGTFNDVNIARQIRVNGVPLAGGDDAKSWYLTGQYSFGNNTLRAAYGQTDTGIDREDTIDNWRLGYQYNLSKRTWLWAEYIGRDANTLVYGDQNIITTGLRHLF